MNSKKYIVFLILVISTQFGCEKNYVEPAGLLDGFSFEEDPIQFSSYLTFGDDYTLSWTNEEAFDGDNSLRITSGKRENQTFAYWNLSYSDFEINKPFKIKVRVKTVDMEGNGGLQVNMFARNKDRSGNITSGIGENITTTNGEWQTIEVSLSQSPNDLVGVIDIYFLLLPDSKGTVYFDKLEVYTGE